MFFIYLFLSLKTNKRFINFIESSQLIKTEEPDVKCEDEQLLSYQPIEKEAVNKIIEQDIGLKSGSENLNIQSKRKKRFKKNEKITIENIYDKHCQIITVPGKFIIDF